MGKSSSSEYKVILKHSSIYLVANFLNRIIGFLMIPVYTRFLTPADYGILELITISMTFLSIIVAAGITEAVARFYFDYEDKKGKNVVISTALFGIICIGGLFYLIVFPFSKFIALTLLDSDSYSSFIHIAVAYMSLDLIFQVILAYFRVTQKSVTLTISSVVKLIISLSLNIYFVVFLQIGVKGILLSTLITNIVMLLVLIPLTFKNTGCSYNFKLLINMIRFGAPLILSMLSHQIVTLSDRYFIKAFSTLADTGLYSLGYKMGALIIAFVGSPFDMIWTPRRFKKYGDEESEQVFARIFSLFIFVITFVGLYISILIKDILKIMVTEPFWDAYQVVSLITLTYIFYSFYYHFNITILMKKKTGLHAGINITTAAVNLILNYFLIKAYSIWGAAVATMLSYAFRSGITYYFSNRLHPIYMETKNIIIILSNAIIVYGLCLLIEMGNVYLNLVLKGLAGLLYIVILYLIGFFREEEIDKFKEIVKKGLAKVGLRSNI